ncbi:30S ribosomal protein S12 methylthiotransferase RimO [Flammeovirga kamogawensis]|uniref:Ribosomal protein uS12 methylthiotransferase RimO n=1 Tax=Flammeovirga kamogawensis TaxID=373891 RepID=A0ABX8GU55_9BACT|nr:30S ribosomal protein S12 methylthiotransferase RimO [Flammeovirga kamogawensis]MBB6459901.1 ribosomal protein S12 methylthiotransferase [Flammeovirga kamogawensis]QWG07046.1 30S ribosomal protein S12 methylthiotransferase RimO [Flammeovirga kamogawensis]TRX68868.1 30S ribosomal protein S12 methylthiotransferase RimO [Flammeovirga kamogawensis]
MKTKTLKENKVNIITLGCSKNIVDSEVIMTQLKGNGIDVVHEAEDDKFNIALINTCGFIGHAKTESIETILRYADAKKEGLIDKVYVSGCLSERYKEDLVNEIPEVDAFFGTREVPNLLRALNADYKKELLGERLLTTDKHFGYLKIAEGCDRPCSFCAIPLMRGKHVSTPIEELVKQAEDMVAKGVKEILLIAQDLTYYGLDIYKKRRLADLLRALSDVEGLEWIRLHYAYPTGFPMDVIDVMKERDNIANYLDIPLQHGSTEMLKRMRRGTSREKQEQLINDIRAKIPNIAIRTTLITGHPGETEEEFEEMLDFVERMRFERVGVFTYSHEEDTHAGDDMEDTIPEDVKQERADEIMQIQEEISAELNQEKVGKVFRVLFDKIEGGYFVGRTEYDSPEVDNEVLVPVEEKNHVRLGDFADVKITSAEPFDLYGEIV